MIARIVPTTLLASSLLVLPAAADLQVPLITPAAHHAAADASPAKPAGGKAALPPPRALAAPRTVILPRGGLASRSLPPASVRPFLVRDGGVPALPAVGSGIPEDAPPERAVQAWLGKILAPTVDLFKLPDAHSTWVSRLKAGQKVAIASQWQGWFAILMNDGSQAYVPQGYVEVEPYRVKSIAAPETPAPAPSAPQLPESPQVPYGPAAGALAQAVIQAAFRYEGVPYLYGGNDAKGIDCSGLVRNCFGECGIQMPRQAHLQAEVGQPVPLDQLQPGDRLYFSVRKPFDHTGIYLGNGSFIHAASSRHKVAVDRLSTPLYGQHLTAARR